MFIVFKCLGVCPWEHRGDMLCYSRQQSSGLKLWWGDGKMSSPDSPARKDSLPQTLGHFSICLSCRHFSPKSTFFLGQLTAREWLQEVCFHPTMGQLWWAIYIPKVPMELAKSLWMHYGSNLPFTQPCFLLFHGYWFLINIPCGKLSHHLWIT